MKITAKHMLAIARLLLAASRKLTPKAARGSALVVAMRGLDELCFIRKMAQVFWLALGGSAAALLTDFMLPRRWQFGRRFGGWIHDRREQRPSATRLDRKSTRLNSSHR